MNDFLPKPVRFEGLQQALVQAGAARLLATESQSGNVSQAAGVLDFSAIAELAELTRGNDPGFLPRFVATYRKEGGALVEEIRRAAGEGDGPGLKRAAHTLKGTSSTIGAIWLPDLCEQIERLDVPSNDLGGMVAAVQLAHREVLALLEAHLSG